VLWKELYIDRGETFGWVGRWLSRLMFWLLVGSSAIVLLALGWAYATQPAGIATYGLHKIIGEWIAATSTFVLWLLQWAIGLRASAAVASERQRATWDALLVSPLEGREILWGKTWGSLFALRWLAVAAVLAWTAATIADELSVLECCERVGLLVFGGAFMAVLGAAVSIGSRNTTKGMATTLGLWGAAAIVTVVSAGILTGVSLLFVEAARATLSLLINGPYAGPAGRPLSLFDYFYGIYTVVRLGLYSVATAGIGWYLKSSFDSLAGRMPESKSFVAAESVSEETPAEPSDGDVTVGAAVCSSAATAENADSCAPSPTPGTPA
jgi:ABC-type transport system involved in multi-copper enzyme maturation permease subunit